jgi:outer membrane protein OmpA-like peptidoglycan-associated protein
MTRKSLLLCTAMAFAAANPQHALSESLDAVQGGIRLAQAPVPHEDKDKDKRPPGQHPPGAATPPGRPGAPTTTQQQPHPGGTPPATAQTPPSQPAYTPPAAAQTPPTGQPHVPPPAALQTTPRPGTPGGQPGTMTPPAAQNVAPTPTRPGAQGVATPTQGVPQRPAVAAAPIDPKTMPQRLDQVKAERKETHERNTTIIQESNRTIIQEGGHTIIRHDPSDRFRLNAQAVNVVTRGNVTVTAVVQPGGFQIVTETDVNGRLLRRIRRDAAGRDVILIDNSFEPRGPGIAGFVLDLRPPVVTIAPQLYIRDVAGATLADVSLTLAAPPVDRIERRYALDEILYNEPLRARMPRVDIDTVNFETGSWEITPDQAPRLEFVAQGILAALKRNPGEMFLIEGYTDAVGNDVDNLSLSDHRAESVAVLLTNQFGVPAENLTTQGYGKQFLKVPTPGPERANRRVAVRRITPLLTGGQS